MGSVRFGRKILVSVFLLAVVGSAYGEKTKPYREFNQDGVGFYGRVDETVDPRTLDSIRIGLLLPLIGPGPEAVRAGVEKAVAEANDRGGYQGIPFETVFRSDDGPWGIAAKQIVAFRYEDNVWAIIGGLDGHKTHLAELVAAKSWIPVVSPTASDLSVDYANVPWVFRLAPDDARRAALILDRAYKNGWRKLVVLHEGDRESRVGVERLLEEANRRRQPPARVIEYSSHRPGEILNRLDPDAFDAAVVWGGAKTTVGLVRRIRDINQNLPILIPAAEALIGLDPESLGPGVIIAAASGVSSENDQDYIRFRRQVESAAGRPFHPYALFGYDAAGMIIRAIEEGGLNRPAIRERLAKMKFTGLTGQISFNSLGGSNLQPGTLSLDHGRWVARGRD